MGLAMPCLARARGQYDKARKISTREESSDRARVATRKHNEEWEQERSREAYSLIAS